MTPKHERMWKTAMQRHQAAMTLVADYGGTLPNDKQLWAVSWLCYHSRNLQLLAAARQFDDMAFEQVFEKVIHFARQVMDRFSVSNVETAQAIHAAAA
ncbi:MAG TPA: hypothetical protein VE988_10665 [Gemmataceae bacterium]|nr:hypothetical protein [Gemmataceae bacterium]